MVLDVAHNLLLLRCWQVTLAEADINHRIKQISVVIGLMADKDARGFIVELTFC